MQGFDCGTVKIFSAFISRALVRPELWKKSGHSALRVPHLDYIKANHLDSNQTWNETGGIIENNSMICLQTHTHTQICIFLHRLRNTHLRASVPQTRFMHPPVPLTFSFVFNLISFRKNELSLMGFNLAGLPLTFLFFPISIVLLTHQLMAGLGADKLANAADRLKNCLAEWWVTAAKWMIGSRNVTNWD